MSYTNKRKKKSDHVRATQTKPTMDMRPNRNAMKNIMKKEPKK